MTLVMSIAVQFVVMALPAMPLLLVETLVWRCVIWVVWLAWMLWFATGERLGHNCFVHMAIQIPAVILYQGGLLRAPWLWAWVAWTGLCAWHMYSRTVAAGRRLAGTLPADPEAASVAILEDFLPMLDKVSEEMEVFLSGHELGRQPNSGTETAILVVAIGLMAIRLSQLPSQFKQSMATELMCRLAARVRPRVTSSDGDLVQHRLNDYHALLAESENIPQRFARQFARCVAVNPRNDPAATFGLSQMVGSMTLTLKDYLNERLAA